MSYTEIMKHLLGRYFTHAVLARPNEMSGNFKKCLLAMGYFSQVVCELRLLCGSVHNKQTLRWLSANGTSVEWIAERQY